MPETSGDTMPRTFDDPSLDWSTSADAEAPPPGAATPDQTAPATTTPEAATTPLAAAPESGEAPRDDERGPIPLDRHKAILEAERQSRAELDAKWQRVAWADELLTAGKTPEQVQQALALYDGIDADPTRFMEAFYEQLQNHPTYAPQVRSWAGKVLAGGRKPLEATDAEADPEPTPDYQNEQGIPFFSGPQLRKWHDWSQRQQDARFQQQLQPLTQAHEQAQARDETARMEAAATTQVTAQLKEMRAKPYFTEHEADIKAYLAARGYRASLESAYVHVLTTQVLPTLKATERSDTIAALKTQAAASTAQPSAAAPATPIRPRTFDDPRLTWT